MIRLTAQIGSLPSSVTIGANGNNQSANATSLLGARASQLNPFMLGVSTFEDNATFSNSVPFFVGNKPIGTDKLILTIGYSSEELSGSLDIIFDTYNNQYPRKIEKIILSGLEFVVEETYENDSNHVFINDLKQERAYLFQFSDWTLTTYPVRIESIRSGINIAIDTHNKISYNGGIADRADYKLPSWGIISNVGDLSFNDTDGTVLEYANLNVLNEGITVKAYIEDTLSGKKQQVGDFLTDTWNYDNDNKEVNVSLKDDLEEWQDIYVEGFGYDPRNIEPKTARYFYDYLFGETPSKYKMKKYEELDGITQTVLNETKINYPLLESGSLWQQWTKLCQLCALHIYKNSQGETVCVHDSEG